MSLIEYVEEISIQPACAESERLQLYRLRIDITKSRCLVIGVVLIFCGTLMSMAVFGIISCKNIFSFCGESLSNACGDQHTCGRPNNRWTAFLRGRSQRPLTGISAYFNLFGRQQQSIHHLSGDSSSSHAYFSGPQLVIAGKMTVEDGPCNIAQLNLKNNEWSLSERIQLSLYNSYSGGEVYSLLANHSSELGDNGGERYGEQGLLAINR
jgi:hypothetical protein